MLPFFVETCPVLDYSSPQKTMLKLFNEKIWKVGHLSVKRYVQVKLHNLDSCKTENFQSRFVFFSKILTTNPFKLNIEN